MIHGSSSKEYFKSKVWFALLSSICHILLGRQTEGSIFPPAIWPAQFCQNWRTNLSVNLPKNLAVEGMSKKNVPETRCRSGILWCDLPSKKSWIRTFLGLLLPGQSWNPRGWSPRRVLWMPCSQNKTIGCLSGWTNASETGTKEKKHENFGHCFKESRNKATA